MGLYSTSKALLSTWASQKKRQLQNRGTPNTKVDSGGNRGEFTFDGQEITRSELRDVKDMRESGGVISQLVHGKVLMQFGTGASFEAEEDEAADWLHDQFNDLDNLLINIGEDATWFPYSVVETVETAGGDFSHIELVEPWTLLPIENEVGEIIAWEQQIKGDFGRHTETFDPEEIGSFVLNKASGRDKTGLSEVLRAEEEISNYKENQQTINDALEFLVPHNHWIVGNDNGAIISDNELRRVRNMVNDMEGDTQFITGSDVEHDEISLSEFDVKTITNNDLRQVALALGVPIELASVISEGLGSGEQSGVRELYFDLERKAKQRSLGGQFVEKIARPMLEKYSPYDPDQELELRFEEAKDITEKKQVVDAIGDDMTVNERREAFDLAPLDDDSIGEDFERPAQETGGDDGLDNIFGEERELQDSFTDYPAAASENAQMALDAKEETGDPNDCGTQVGWERANQLANNEPISEDTVSRMSQFARHEDNSDMDDEEGRADCGWMMWKAWGGDEGIEWAEDKMDELEAGGTGNKTLSEYADWESALLETFHKAHTVDGNITLTNFSDSALPEFAQERIRDAINAGALFSHFDDVPSSELMDLRSIFKDELTDDGWSINAMRDELIDRFGLSPSKAETIARTETAAVANKAREIGYEERGAEDSLFYWEGTFDDGRTTDACQWLLEQTNPQHGGSPVPLDELKSLIEEAPTHDDDMQDDLARPEQFTVHPNERKTWVRDVEASFDAAE